MKNYPDILNITPTIGSQLTPEQAIYVTHVAEEIAQTTGRNNISAKDIETILLDKNAFTSAGYYFLPKVETIRYHTLFNNQDIPSDIATHLNDQQSLQEEAHECLFKSLILAEHAIHSCEQTLKHPATEYSDTYRMLMQQRIATYTKHMALLKQMITDR